MQALSWRAVDSCGVLFAGLTGGYVMAIAGLWAGRVPGFATLDIADFGRRYMSSDTPAAWLFGLVSHLANSILLTFLWASFLIPNFPGSWPKVLLGIAWGEFLALTLAGALVAPMSGLGLMGRKTGNMKFGLTNFLLHAIWGLLIGLIYVPPQ